MEAKNLLMGIIVIIALLIGFTVGANYDKLLSLMDEEQNEIVVYSNMSGIVSDIDEFVQDGNTRWIVSINQGNSSGFFVAKAETLNYIMLDLLSDIKVGDHITAMIDQKYNLYAIRKN